MQWRIIPPDRFQTSLWAGGSTTQLAIFPPEARYADRDFLWRVSSAQVELTHSVFTSLPDYDRFLSTLEGDLVLEMEGSGRRTLRPLEVCQFDGGLRVESWGMCRDFNLMLRKGRCTGEMTALHLERGEHRLCRWEADVAGLYCCTGSLGWLQAGQFALADRPAPLELTAQAETTLLAVQIRYPVADIGKRN